MPDPETGYSPAGLDGARGQAPLVHGNKLPHDVLSYNEAGYAHDCGFGTFAGREYVAEEVVWVKLAAAAEGARIASHRLWGRAGR
jgi:hypothetical protein